MKDPLTGLMTRNSFFDKAENYVREVQKNDKKTVMVAFDLCGMKVFNARFGVSEGDRLLCVFAELLCKIFGNEKCSRFGEDHFFAVDIQDGIEDRINDLIQELKESNRGLTLPVKIGTCVCQEGISVHLACDYARMACDEQKSRYGSSYGNFDEKTALRYVKAEYILSHLDQALNEGWIHVCLQPVVRALSGEVCSLEALARWKDPVYGYISPGDFVPLLEENGLSHKLDIFIVKRVINMLARDINAGKPVVPVSVNISRADFNLCNPVEIIINTLDKYNVRRNLICVEVTETALMNDSALMKKAINSFHEAGIDIWMDDFGSGYSSLNVLKDFDFDEIKIDMSFLKDFSDKSKTIITMAVKMAKELGIHTLAEGVENIEQLDFLRNIGCEKIQGYYYSKPMTISSLRGFLAEKNLAMETREKRSVYEKTGLIDLATDQAVALFFYSNSRFNYLYSNNHYNETVGFSSDYIEEEVEREMNKDDNISLGKFHQLAEKAISTHQEERMIFVVKGHYYRVSFKDVADSRQGSMIFIVIDGKEYENLEEMHLNDYVLRNVISAFDCIYLLDYKEDTRKVIYSNLINENVGDEYNGIKEFYDNYKQRVIYPDDILRWKDFVNLSRNKLSVLGGDFSFSDIFRFKDQNGNYVWTEIMIVVLAGYEDRKALACVRTLDIEEQARIYDAGVASAKTNIKNHSINDSLMDAVIRDSGVRFFWKDKDRRFLGVTQAFLDFYGFKSPDVVIGKTDEEVGWHIDDTPFMSDEERVLKRGEIIRNAIGQNVVDGVTRYIAATKFPVYENGKIVGLMGYMIDVERDPQSEESLRKGSLMDTVTGGMNTYGQMITLTQLEDNLRANGEDFVYVSLEVQDLENIREDYGRDIAEKYIRTVFGIIVDVFGHTASIFRTYGCCFCVTKRNMSDEAVIDLSEKWKVRVDNIREIEGRQIMVTGSYAFARGSERDNVQEIVELARARLIQKHSGDSVRENSLAGHMKELYDNMPLPYIVARPILDKDGSTAVDIEFIYANSKYCEQAGKNASEIIDNRFSRIYPRLRNTKWLEIAKRASSGEYIYDRTFSYAIKHWVNFVSSPGSIPGTFLTVLMNMDEGMQQAQLSAANHATVDANKQIAKILDSELDVETSLKIVLKELGNVIKADKIFAFKDVSKDKDIDYSILKIYLEWSQDGSYVDDSQNVNELNILIEPWRNVMENKMSLSVEDVETIRGTYPEVYEYLKSRSVNCLSIVPMFGGNVLIGYLCAFNYLNSISVDVLSVMENAAYMIANRIMLRILRQKEQKISIEKSIVNRKLKTKDAVIKIARILSGNDSYADAMNKMLEILKEVIVSDRLFIMEVNQKNDTISNTFEWCSDNAVPVIEEWQNIRIDHYAMHFEEFKPGTCLVINNDEEYKAIKPVRSDYLSKQSIRNVIEAPFYNNGVLLGYIGVDNYNMDDEENIKQLLENISYFIGFRVHNNMLEKKSNCE